MTTTAAGSGLSRRVGPDGPHVLTERQSYVIVGIAHLVLLAALSLALRSVTPPVPPADAVAVEIVSYAAAGAPPPPAAAPTPVAAKPAPPPEATPLPPVPEAVPDKLVEKPVPEAKPEPKPAPEPKPEKVKPEPKADQPKAEKPKPDKPKPKPEKPKPTPERLDTDALSTLLDRRVPKPKAKSLDAVALSKSLDAALPKAKPLDTAALSKSLDAALPKGAPKAPRGDPRAGAAIAAAIRAQVTPCWNLPVGAATAGKVTTVLHLDINRDGTIAGRPGLVGQTGVTGANADYARAIAETARRAVLRCAPLKLPADSYDQWKAVEINFDPTTI